MFMYKVRVSKHAKYRVLIMVIENHPGFGLDQNCQM